MFEAIFSEFVIDEIEADLRRVARLLNSDLFLSGLGAVSSDVKIVIDAPVITDIQTACEMMTSQDIWDTPEPWPYQYFVGEIEDESSKFEYGNFICQNRKRALDIYRFKMDDFGQIVFNVLNDVYQRHGVKRFLIERNLPESSVVTSSDVEKIEYIVCDSFVNDIAGYLKYMVGVAIIVGLDESSFYRRMLEIFEAGGLPCGWLGGVRYEGGADPNKCMAMLHYGHRLQ